MRDVIVQEGRGHESSEKGKGMISRKAIGGPYRESGDIVRAKFVGYNS